MRYAVDILEKIRKQVIVAATSVEDAKINGLAIAKDIESNERRRAKRLSVPRLPSTSLSNASVILVTCPRNQLSCFAVTPEPSIANAP